MGEDQHVALSGGTWVCDLILNGHIKGQAIAVQTGREAMEEHVGLVAKDFFLTCGGHVLDQSVVLASLVPSGGRVHLVPRVRGGVTEVLGAVGHEDSPAAWCQVVTTAGKTKVVHVHPGDSVATIIAMVEGCTHAAMYGVLDGRMVHMDEPMYARTLALTVSSSL